MCCRNGVGQTEFVVPQCCIIWVLSEKKRSFDAKMYLGSAVVLRLTGDMGLNPVSL